MVNTHSFRVSDEIYAYAIEDAKRHEMNISEYIRFLISEKHSQLAKIRNGNKIDTFWNPEAVNPEFGISWANLKLKLGIINKNEYDKEVKIWRNYIKNKK